MTIYGEGDEQEPTTIGFEDNEVKVDQETAANGKACINLKRFGNPEGMAFCMLKAEDIDFTY